MYGNVNAADSDKDLKWFSNFHGVDMPMNWPAFEVRKQQLAEKLIVCT
jgi:hypothetical protein